MEIKMVEEDPAPAEENHHKNLKVTSSVLDAFDLLRAERVELKLTGGARIITQLYSNEDDKDFRYVLKRLVRSLGANVPAMRTGYFATLVTLLSKIDNVTVSELLQLVKKELHAGNASKSEVGDVALGQILVCGAIFRSGLMMSTSEDEQKEVITLLLTASQKKSYLGTIAYLMLLDFVKNLSEEQFSSVVWSSLKVDLKKDIKDHTLDSLYFLLVVSKKFPNKVKLRKLLGVPELLCEDTIPDICEKLMAKIDYNTVTHPIYHEIGVQISNSPHLKLFWASGIDGQLTKHNRNRELVALNILNDILHNLTDNVEVIPDLISINFFKLFMDWFKGLQTASKIRFKRDDEDDHKIMIKKEKEVLQTLAKCMKSEKITDQIRVETLKKLLFNPGEMNFTEATGTSLVKAIISDLEKDGTKKLAKSFKGVLLNTTKKTVKEGVERNWYNNERQKAAELLSYLVTQDSVKDDVEFKLTYMKLLMCFGFFKIGGDENVAISSELSGAIKISFYRCFGSRFTNVDDLLYVLSSLCSFIISSLQKEQIRAKLEKQFPKESMECWEMVINICQNIEKKDQKSKVDKVFLILLYQLGLFLFSEPAHMKAARSSIKELKSCYEHYTKDKKKKPQKLKENEVPDEPEWLEVLVEVLLSILSVESSVLRSIVQCVFRLLWEFLTPTTIGQIVSVLDPESESNPLANGVDSDDEDEEGDSDKEGDDDEESDDDDDEAKKKSNEESGESDSEEEEDDEMTIPDQLRMAVQKALGGAANESDAESVDADMIDEEEGKQLDEALAEAFKQFGQGKGKKNKKERKDKKALSDFRIRVLDLLNIYLEKDPSMDICLSMIAPLTRCLEFCIQDNQFSELENRVRKTIKTLTKVRKFSSSEGINMDILCEYLKATIDKGDRSHFMFQAVGDVITFFATFIINCSQKIGVKNPKSPKKKKAPSPLVEILKEAMQNYFQNRSCLLPIIFFHNILQMDWEGNFEIVPIITENIFNSEVRQFRRNEGIELLAGFYRSLKRNKPTSEQVLSKLSELEKNFENTLTIKLKGKTLFDIKNNFFIALKKLINIIKSFHESTNINSEINFDSLFDIVSSCKGTAVKVKLNQDQHNHNGVQKQQGKKKKKKNKRKIEKVNGHSEPKTKKVKTDSEECDAD
ncbi:myb-binding protein 1A-like protein [Ostrinia nubilalis]|uniref:myb-binding protein 1A-like protein n=1 Tax=Ostrinia nubilalis TaxID=29057 RepID=UPI0030823E14